VPAFALARRLRAGETVFGAWCMLGSPIVAETIAREGFPAVVLDAQILGKPRDETDCVRMLRLLSGRTHQVFTAVALQASTCQARVNVSEVTFRKLTDEEIRHYWRSGEPADKAGAYAVQGRAALFIERIAGSYSGIMGLPLFETGELLAGIGARA